MRTMRAMGFFAGIFFAIFSVASIAVATDAAAETITFRVQHLDGRVGHIRFFSMDRQVQWPAPGQGYPLRDYGVHEYRLSCNRNERICYGAWVLGSGGNLYWGAGIHGNNYCANCCYTCHGNTTQLIVLHGSRR